MRRVGQARTFDEQIAYHLANGRAPEFDKGQPGRVSLARFLIDKIIAVDDKVESIVELGCGAGDISGPYTRSFRVNGYDITPAAQAACNERWPRMDFHLEPVEHVTPYETGIIVLTEFLEHVDNPVSIVQKWLPLARWAVIGHPLDEPDPPIEPGHIWSFTRDDWRRWFALGNHQWQEEFRFPMGGWDAMILGHSRRIDG